MNNEMVSIIVPVFNVEEYVERCIVSVLQQEYDNWELILIDDGSTDGSGTICDKYALKDKRIRVVHTENRGVSNARNTGLDMIQGEYVLFADSDDWLESGMLTELLLAFKRNNSDVVACDVFIVKEDDERVTRDKANKWGTIKEDFKLQGKDIYYMFLKNSGTLWNKLFKSNIIKNIRFNINQSYGEDTDFLIKALENVNIVTLIPYVGYNYYINRKGNVVSAYIDERSLEWIENTKDLYKNLSEKEMNSMGIYRLFFVCIRVIRKIPVDDYRNDEYKMYYDAIRKAARIPKKRHIISFFFDSAFCIRNKIVYFLMLINPSIIVFLRKARHLQKNRR